MTCDYYRVTCDGFIIADGMTLETACLLVRALFEVYYQEPALQYTIERQSADRAE